MREKIQLLKKMEFHIFLKEDGQLYIKEDIVLIKKQYLMNNNPKNIKAIMCYLNLKVANQIAIMK